MSNHGLPSLAKASASFDITYGVTEGQKVELYRIEIKVPSSDTQARYVCVQGKHLVVENESYSTFMIRLCQPSQD